MIYLSETLWFPDVAAAGTDGLLALGGDLTTDRLLLAYQSGIFPWFSDGDPILWWSPNPRMVLFLNQLKVSKSLGREIKKQRFTITVDQAFTEVIQHCAHVTRPEQAGTWITDEMMQAYIKLHKLGHARSVEVWEGDQLVGGLYGIDLPGQKVFCGESMFSKVSNASKIALYHWVELLKKKQYQLIDCQVYNPHLESLGAVEISRARFMNYLK